MESETIDIAVAPVEDVTQEVTEMDDDNLFRISAITRDFLRGFYEDFLLGSKSSRSRFMLERFLRVSLLEGRILAEKRDFRPHRMIRALYADTQSLPALRLKMLRAHSPEDVICYTEAELDTLFQYALYDGMRAEFADWAAKIEEE